MLSENSQTHRANAAGSHLLGMQNSQRQTEERRRAVTGTGGNGDLWCNGYRVSVWGDEEILEMDGGNGIVLDATEL